MKLSDLKDKFLDLLRVKQPEIAPEPPLEHHPQAELTGRTALDPTTAYQQHLDDMAAALADDLRRWDGKSVKDIPVDRLLEHPSHDAIDALQATVPQAYRDELWGAKDPDDRQLRSALRIIAIDSNGDALVKLSTVDAYLMADGTTYDVMPKGEAFSRHDHFVAAHDQFLGRENSLDQDGPRGGELDAESDPLLWDGSVEVNILTAEPSGTYRGVILNIEGYNAYQMLDDGRACIAHHVRMIFGVDRNDLVGRHVEISYPCGQVGLVRDLDKKGHSLLDHHEPTKQHVAGDLER